MLFEVATLRTLNFKYEVNILIAIGVSFDSTAVKCTSPETFLAIKTSKFSKYFPNLWMFLFTKKLSGRNFIQGWELAKLLNLPKYSGKDTFTPYSLLFSKDYIVLTKIYGSISRKTIAKLVKTLEVLEQQIREKKDEGD